MVAHNPTSHPWQAWPLVTELALADPILAPQFYDRRLFGLDLPQVATEEAQSYADENGLVYWETSAKTNANVTELFEDIAKR